ncbi:ABC transporter ATP-binding protein [Desulfocapsa sp. AH-315-G09]|nr:ABC transporter ATP-binding protein [Desulfocapsa sp.]MBN4046026.1 ABC transporter ATP-binding protein [bacterium AH-315-P11]MBN4048785.1 ABC transporter ATP-binding protein [bacterium AH-315-N22]MBN4065678.1 ABC transporter ATP-binding protein [Desulfocapsa sp. AH-315-G09]
MQLELRNVSTKVGDEFHITDISLAFEAGTLNILLGSTLSGKTSLMRLMAGLDQPTSGKIYVRGKDVTGVAVQKRNVAMVYQQFINYPNLTVYENIASPLRIAKVGKKSIEGKVAQVSKLLKLENLLQRKPHELSGGQQQRTALARALIKGAELVLLDEPLANLDYKLREELREELPHIFAETGAIFVYATTEPSEALLLGGNTVSLHEGRVTQFGPTIDVFRRPANLITARTLSDPPLNTLPVTKLNNRMLYKSHVEIPLIGRLPDLADDDYTIAFRPHHLYLKQTSDSMIGVKAKVVVAEITGSESFIHIDVTGMRWVVLAQGIHNPNINETIEVFLDPSKFYVFDRNEQLVVAPEMTPGV